MRPLPPDNRGGGLDPDEQAIREYRERWLTGEPSFEAFWRGLGPGRSLPLLSALAKIELKARFDRGERPTAGEILGRFPELAEDGSRVISLAYEEFCLLEEAGEGPDSADFCAAYAPWGDSLRSQLAYHRELSRAVGAPAPSVPYPKPGDRFAAYHLRSLLGKGGAAHVYMAFDENLGRTVALKVSASVGREPSILANLDHPNIVPIHSMTEPTEDGLRGFSMPYRPGITLDDLIRQLGRGKPGRKADPLWKALNPANRSSERPESRNRPGWSGFPIRGTFHEAVAWLGAKLAGAVHYLHQEHGVIHRDIKPANILLADREGPQLLDFHLAHAPNAPDHAQAALNGGTLPYMAPEQLRAFLDRERWEDVGQAADIYALGLVLREMVTGRGPDLPDPDMPLPRAISGLLDRREEPALPVREVEPSIPPSLGSIIDQCLAPAPGDRYPSARALADDLNRFLGRRPLASAPNPSSIERLVNLLCRQRKVVLGVAIVLAMMAPNLRSRYFRPAFIDRPEVKAAIDDLDSLDRGRWIRSKSFFEQAHSEDPRSAYPSIYLSQASEKLSEITRANDLIAEARTCPDFDEAIERRIKEKPTSISLLVSQVERFLGLGRVREAEALLAKIRGIEPTHPGALRVSGSLERSRDNYAGAIRYFRAAIDSTSKRNLGEDKILPIRMALVPVLRDQAEKELTGRPDAGALERSSDLFAQLGRELEIVTRARPGYPQLTGMEKWDFTRDYFSGLMESGLGAIENLRGDKGRAAHLLASARDHLERAERAVGLDDKSRVRVRTQLKNLETRSSTPR